MNLAFVCAGDINVPPRSWGAVEIVVWEYYKNLMSLGHKVKIYNIKDIEWVKKDIEKSNYDFVHLQHEDLLPSMNDIKVNKMAVTAHCGWAENIEFYDPYYWKTFKYLISTPHFLFALSEKIKNNYANFRGSDKNIFITKNGVNFDFYRKEKKPKFYNRSIYLGRYEYRKRQFIISNKDLNIDFAGFGDELILSANNANLGIWNKSEVYNCLTDYANLILLSISEAHPLVCMEALSAGCGLVLSEKSAANLDLSKKFITVIPENKLNDENYLKQSIEQNREYSIKNRDEILEYAKIFDWKNITQQYVTLIRDLI